MIVHITSAVWLILTHIFWTVGFFDSVFWWWNSTGINALSTRTRCYKRPLNFMTVKMKNVAFNTSIELFFQFIARAAGRFYSFIGVTRTFRIQIRHKTFFTRSSIIWNNRKVLLRIGSYINRNRLKSLGIDDLPYADMSSTHYLYIFIINLL